MGPKFVLNLSRCCIFFDLLKSSAPLNPCAQSNSEVHAFELWRYTNLGKQLETFIVQEGNTQHQHFKNSWLFSSHGLVQYGQN